jgi:hypothetical protein
MLLPASFLHCSYLHNALIRNQNKTKTKPKQNVHGRHSPLQQLGLALRRCLRCTVTRHASAAALAAAARRTHTTPAADLAAAARGRVTCALRAACSPEPPLPALSTPPARPVTSHLTLQPTTHITLQPTTHITLQPTTHTHAKNQKPLLNLSTSFPAGNVELSRSLCRCRRIAQLHPLHTRRSSLARHMPRSRFNHLHLARCLTLLQALAAAHSFIQLSLQQPVPAAALMF